MILAREYLLSVLYNLRLWMVFVLILLLEMFDVQSCIISTLLLRRFLTSLNEPVIPIPQPAVRFLRASFPALVISATFLLGCVRSFFDGALMTATSLFVKLQDGCSISAGLKMSTAM